MRRILSTMIGMLALATSAQSGVAADLPAAPSYKGPMAPAAYNWTGIYVGVNGGYGWGQQDPLNLFTNRFDNVSMNLAGGMIGGTLGAQIQSGHVVLGFEADLDWANLTGSGGLNATIGGVPFALLNASTNISSIATLRGRVGYAADNWLFFGTFGVSVMGSNTTISLVNGATCGTGGPALICSGASTRIGAALGGGVEYGFTPNWSVKAEYLYLTGISFTAANVSAVRLGVNYRFGGL